MRQPGVDVSDKGGGQITGLAKAPSEEILCYVVLPKLKEYGNPCPQGGTPNMDV